MINPDHRRYFIPESGIALEKANAYREECNRVRQIHWAHVVKLGGTHYTNSMDGGIGNIRFPKDPPHGFKPAKKSHDDMPGNLYKPRFGSKVGADIAALPKLPNVLEYLDFTNMLTEVDYRPEPGAPECKAPIGDPKTPLCFIDWFSPESPMLLVIPDQAITCAALKRKYPEVVFLHDEHKHDPNTEGMREIILKEYELMEEKFRRGMA